MSKVMRTLAALLSFSLLIGCASSSGSSSSAAASNGGGAQTPASQGATTSSSGSIAGTYSEQTVLAEAEDFFGDGAAGLADVVEAAFREQGRPNAYIKGEEVSGAVGVGLRYGAGTLVLANGESRDVYWQGPSLGFDLGGNASKAFILVYNLADMNSLFQRFPGVEGSLYFVGGVSVNYNQSGNTVLAPIRFGVGWRQGANIGYLHVRKDKSWVPF